MAILKRIKSAAKKVVTGVKNTATKVVNKVASSLTPSTSSSKFNPSTASAIGAVTSATSAIGKAAPAKSNPLSTVTAKSYGTQFGPTSAPTTPAVSYGSQFAPTSKTAPSRSGGNWGTSDYSSPSYSTDFGAVTPPSFESSSPSEQRITAGALGSGTTSYVMPSAPSATNYSSDVVANNVMVGANPSSGMIEQEGIVKDTSGNLVPQAQEQKSDARSSLDEMLGKLREPASEAKLYKKALKESGLNDAIAQRNNTQNQINAITSKMNADLLQLRGTAQQEGVTEAVYGGQQAQVSREATIKLLPLQAQLAIDQGNVELAQSNTETLFKMYASDAKNAADFYNKQVEKIYDLATKEEQRRYDEKKSEKTFKADLVKEDARMQSDTANELLKSGDVAGYRALTAIRPPVNVNSPSFDKDYQNYKQDLVDAMAQYAPTVSGNQILAKLPASIQGKVISLATEFGNKDIAKKYNATVDAINIINGIDPESTNPSDHQQVVFAFAKALDPESVVREGEYETIKKYSQSLAQKYKKEFTNAISGTGFLSEDAIKNIQSTMNNTFNSRKPIYENAAKETARIINNIAGADVAGELMVDYAGGVNPIPRETPGSDTITLTPEEQKTVEQMKADGLSNDIIEKAFGGKIFNQAGNASASNQVKGFLDSKVYRFENLSPELDVSFPTFEQVSIPSASRLAYVNNNPGNLKYAGQDGAVKGEKGFAKFKTPSDGARALVAQIKLDAKRGHSVKTFINKFAPPTENDTKLYIEQVARMLGVTPETPIAEVDIKKLAAAIARKESSATLM